MPSLLDLLRPVRGLIIPEPSAEHVFAEPDASPLLIVQFTKLSPTAIEPTYATPGAAGMDLYADESATIEPGRRRLIQTNIAIRLPEGFEGQVRSRSGLALKHGICVLNSPGTIDSDYRGGIGVVLFNSSQEPFRVQAGDRIAQLVIAAHYRAELAEVIAFDEYETKRGASGFGSTGLKELI